MACAWHVHVHVHGMCTACAWCVQAPLPPSFAFTGEVKRTEWYSTVSPVLLERAFTTIRSRPHPTPTPHPKPSPDPNPNPNPNPQP
jgi:hypothetical protein